MVKCFKFLFLNIIFLQVLAASLQSQTIEPKFDVLPVVTPRCIFQDSFGFIWIGTFGGMLRYDGYTLKHYSNIPYDSTSLSNNWVFAINEDKSGNLWIGTIGGGLNYFDRRTETFTHYNNQNLDSMDNAISRIMVNEDGSLWLGSGTHGLIWFSKDPAGKVRYLCYPVTDKSAKQLISNNIVLDLHQDKEGLIWIASATEGLIKFNPRTREMIKFKHDPTDPKSISCNTISSICEDDSSNLWLGTGHPNFPQSPGDGLNMYNRRTGEFKHFKHNEAEKNGICSNTLSSLLIDHTGTMWIGSWDNYLNSVSVQDLLTKNNPEFTHYTNLARDMVISLYEDRLYNIWIGVFGMELYKIDQQQNPFAFYSRTDKFPDCLTHSDVAAICVDHLGRVWFGTRGLDGYDPRTGQYTHYYSEPGRTTGLSDNWITGIQEDDNGELWIATRNGGINIFNPESGLVKYLQHHEDEIGGLIDNSVPFILKRPNGDFWIASSKAIIQLYEKKTGIFYNYDLDTENEGDLVILALCEDRDGVLWIGTMNSGMYSLKTESNKLISIDNYRYNPKDRNSLSNIEVTDILHPEVIDTNALWLATIVGLNRFDLKTKTFTHFFQKDGLASDLVLRVLEDNYGNIWCATIDGISVYDIRTGKFKSYGKGDGMPFTDFSNLGKNAAKGPDGQLFFAGVSGALSFYPDQLTNNPNIPTIALTDFKIFQKSATLDTAIQFKRSITLSYHQNAFSFEFAALNFTNAEKNQYAYKMEGFYDDWIYLSNERSASFTNLDPGKYLFRVKGSNNHGIWNEEGTSIRVIITPPWWHTGWAYFAYTLVLSTFLVGTVRFEVRRRHRKLEHQLQREQEMRKLDEAEHRAVVAELERKTAEAQQEAEKEQMRSRIASDLHDEIGSNLSSIALISQVLDEKYKVPKLMKIRLREIPRIARLTAESMRDIVWFINPENDDMDKLLVKMQETANMMLEMLDFTFTVPEIGVIPQTDLNFRRNLYLIYKECLQNIIKHSRAQKAEIELQQVDSYLILRVKDNGVGFDTGWEYSGNGLKNLQRRATDLGGRLEIVAGNGNGTAVTLTIKIP